MKLGVAILLAGLIGWSVISFAGNAGDSSVGSDLSGLQNLDQRTIDIRAPRWRCIVDRQFACTPDSCSSREQSLTLLLDFQSGTYRRCLGNTCDKYNMHSKKWGIYTVVAMEREGGSFLMLLNDGSEFTESISQGIWTLTGFGRCSPE